MGKIVINGPLFVTVLMVLFIPVTLYVPEGLLRILSSWLMVLFFPGYMLVSALYPNKQQLSVLIRITLGIGFSIAALAVIGLILNLTAWGITRDSILPVLIGFVLVISVVALCRQWKLAKAERLTVVFNVQIRFWRGRSIAEQALFLVIILSVLSMMGAVAYGTVNPGLEKFTEFYVLNSESKAEDYPLQLIVGEESNVVVGIINHEDERSSFHVEIYIGADMVGSTDTIVLEKGEKWQQAVSFTPVVSGIDQKLEIVLYKDKESYHNLHLWVNVWLNR